MGHSLIRKIALNLTLLGIVVAAPALLRSQDGAPEAVMPTYDDAGRLERPAGFERWVFIGSSMGLSYSEGTGGMEMFHETLMEPSAYDAYLATGEFREGTMLALLLHGVGESALPQRRGQVAGPVAAIEMAVKDSQRFEEGWAYYHFGDPDDLRDEAEAFGNDSCYDCHVEHGAQDNVFVQFYPMLTGARTRVAEGEPGERLALGGLDPVHLVEGREEPGKPEIVAEFGGYTYYFVSEPSRSRFAAEPQRFAFQNESCIVVPGAAVDPELFIVHEERIYGFASESCIERFQEDPASFLTGEPTADAAGS